MTNVATLVFSLVCLMVVFVDSLKNSMLLWYSILLLLNLVAVYLLIKHPHYFKKQSYWVAAILFPLISFTTYVFWRYILDVMPMSLFGTEQGSLALFVSLLVPAPLAAISLLIIFSVSIPLIFGKVGWFIPASAMLIMMFVFESWLRIDTVIDKLVLYENIWLGVVVSLTLCYSSKWVQKKIT